MNYTREDVERFHSKTIKGEDGCIEWNAYKHRSGYGEFWHQGKMKQAHRAAWEITNGSIPDGLFVLHNCHNPACVNADHLRLGTQKDNMLDKQNANRHACPSGGLTEQQVLEIRRRKKAGEHVMDLALEYKINSIAIHRLLSGKTWSHLPSS